MIEHMFVTVAKMMDIYEVEIRSELTGLKMTIECIGVERDLITEFLNPNIPELKRKQPQLVRLRIAEEHSSEEYLPVHILLGVQDYQRIRTPKLPILGCDLNTDSVAEYTKLG